MIIKAPIINYDTSLRQVLLEDFKSISSELPIHGGWGYTRDEAIVIDKNDPANTSNIFDGVGIEYLIVQQRIHEELIIFRPKEDKYLGITWKLRNQEIIRENELVFDHLVFNVKANHEVTGEPIEYEADYWFEISSFY